MGPGRFEVTPNYSSANFSEDGESEKLQNHFGVQVATGLTPRADLRLRYEYISLVDNGDSGVSVLGAGPKFGLVEDRVAIYAPVGFAFGDDIESGDTWQFQPTVLFTYPFHNYAEATASGRGVIWLGEDRDNFVGANLGLGLSPDLDRWAVRPEVGFLKNPGEEGTAWQWSVGFTIFFGSEN